MKLQLGISGEKLSDVSGAIVEVLTHHWVYTLCSSKPTSDLSADWTYIECFDVVSKCPLTGGSIAFALNNITHWEILLALSGNYKAKKSKKKEEEAIKKKKKQIKKKNKSGKKYHSSSVISRQSVHTHTHTSTFSFLLLWHSKILNNLIFRGRNHDFYGRHNPYEKRSETKMEYSWQRKLKVLAVGWAKDLSLIGWR